MKWLAECGVKAKLFLTLGMLSVLLAAVGLMGVMNTRNVHGDLEDLFKNRLEPAAWIGVMDGQQMRLQLAVDIALMSREPSNLAAAKQTIADARAMVDDVWKQYAATEFTEREQQVADDYMEQRSKLRTTNDRLLEMMAAGDYDAAVKVRANELQPILTDISKSLTDLRQIQVDAAHERYDASLAAFKTRQFWTWSLIVVGIALGVFFGRMLTQSILTALQSAVTVAKRIATGEIGHAVESDRQDELGELLRALHVMDTKLQEIVGNVRVSAESVSAAAREIAQGNDNLSTRTQQQAAALEETASSMEEMTATVRQNAENARQANQLAVSARTNADQGGAVVSGAVQAMGEINESSRKIADIIGVIDEIAFQTNLLALNAAVEAARAGEQGRGFAVVATEVRNLAQRSASAAKEIKELIKDSVEKVNAGSALVDQSGKTLADIVAGVKRVTDIVAEISAASQEQASGIDQVNNAVTQMDESTQQNAALVEEASAASKAMEQQANALLQQVAFFKNLNARQSMAPVQPMQMASARTAAPRAVTPMRKPAAKKPVSRESAAPMAKASGDDSVWNEF